MEEISVLIIKCICDFGNCKKVANIGVASLNQTVVPQLIELDWSEDKGAHFCPEHTEAITQAGEPE
jgi:hypothetical protein